MTLCIAGPLHFQPLGCREIVAEFDGETVTSDGGTLLLREVDQRLGVIEALAECFEDYRDPELIEHPLQQLLAQRVFGIALGYDDLNDHDELRHDPLLATALTDGLTSHMSPPAVTQSGSRSKRKTGAFLRLNSVNAQHAPEQQDFFKYLLRRFNGCSPRVPQ